MNASAQLKSVINSLLIASFAVAIVIFAQRDAHAQQMIVDFRFDSTGTNSMTLLPGTPGQPFTIDMWATVVPAAATANTHLGLQSFGIRGASAPGGSAFATGAGIGVGANPPGSFVQLAPFNPAGFTQPKVSDLGSTNNNGTSISNTTADGILDFGGTLATQKFTSLSNTGGLVFGGGTSGQANPTGGWEWEVAQFKFTTGQASTTVGATTMFVPLQLSSGTATAATFSTDGATAVSGPVTVGSALTFTVLPPPGAIADNSNNPGVYGPPQTFQVPHGGTYNGIESKVTGTQGTGGSDANTGTPGFFGGHAKMLAGMNSNANSGGATVVGMGWRTRLNPSEDGTTPPLPPGVTTGLVSDVVNLTGLTTGPEVAGGPTDSFVLDMSYNPALLPKASTTNNHTTPSTLENGLAHNKLIYMVSPVGPDGTQDVNTVALNTGNVITSPLDSRYGYFGSYAQFQADPAGGNGALPGAELGAWGTDTVLHEVWAVVNHNSTFAVVPEPSTLLLAGLGLLGLFGLRRRAAKVA